MCNYQAGYKLKFDNVTYKYDKEIINITYLIDNVNSKFSVTYDLFKNIDRFTGNVELFTKRTEGPDQPFKSILKKHNNDICAFLKNPKAEPMFYPFWQDVITNKKNKVASTCPILSVSILCIHLYFF